MPGSGHGPSRAKSAPSPHTVTAPGQPTSELSSSCPVRQASYRQPRRCDPVAVMAPGALRESRPRCSRHCRVPSRMRSPQAGHVEHVLQREDQPTASTHSVEHDRGASDSTTADIGKFAVPP